MMKKASIVFSLLFFNVVFILGVAASVYIFIASLWIVTGSFLLSPLLLLGATLLTIQDFSVFQSIARILLFALGGLLVPVCIKATKYVGNISAKYIAYNKRLIYG